jgi:hypothetical protein
VEDVKKCAFGRDNRCTALIDKFCNKCPFFKTAEEVANSRADTQKRISSLPARERAKIITKYYAKKVMIGE